MEMFNILDLGISILSLVTACIALCAAWIIPQIIMLNQQYAELVAAYRSTEMGTAIYSIFDFYKNICKSEDKIYDFYTTQSKKDFEDFYKNKNFDLSKTLHFKRRLVDQYFWLVGDLVFGESRLIRLPKRKLRDWFTENESNLINIILRMNEAARDIEIKVNLPEYHFNNNRQKAMMDNIREKLYKESKKWRKA
jgi:hypothetical protein